VSLHPPYATVTFAALGTLVTLRVAGADPAGLTRAGRAEVERLDLVLSRFVPDSDVSRLNRNAGRWVEVGPDTDRVLRTSRALARATGGAFNPLHEAGRPGRGLGASALIRGEAAPVWWLAPGAALDLDGIAKGYIADAVAGRLRRDGAQAALVCLGSSSLAVFGTRIVDHTAAVPLDQAATPLDHAAAAGHREPLVQDSDADPAEQAYSHGSAASGELARAAAHEPDCGCWRIGIRAPGHARGCCLGQIPLAEGSVSSSSHDEQPGHVVDRRTGRVAEGARGVTVITRDGMTAEAWSTALLVGGVDLLARHAAHHAGIEAVVVTDEAICATPGSGFTPHTARPA
jgi:thiamine biosynthesis lipoprotein